MKASINEDAWTVVEDGWKEPTTKTETGTPIPKPKVEWTDEDKRKAKEIQKLFLQYFLSSKRV